MAISDLNKQGTSKYPSDGLIFGKTNKYIIFIYTLIIIFLIPVYSVTETWKDGRFVKETSYIFPWMILTRYQPNSVFRSDQYSVVALPWSYILHIPSIFIIHNSWLFYRSLDSNFKHLVNIIIALLAQILVIWATYLSQDFSEETGVDSEIVSVFLFPQIILILLYVSLLVYTTYYLKFGKKQDELIDDIND